MLQQLCHNKKLLARYLIPFILKCWMVTLVLVDCLVGRQAGRLAGRQTGRQTGWRHAQGRLEVSGPALGEPGVMMGAELLRRQLWTGRRGEGTLIYSILEG